MYNNNKDVRFRFRASGCVWPAIVQTGQFYGNKVHALLWALSQYVFLYGLSRSLKYLGNLIRIYIFLRRWLSYVK